MRAPSLAIVLSNTLTAAGLGITRNIFRIMAIGAVIMLAGLAACGDQSLTAPTTLKATPDTTAKYVVAAFTLYNSNLSLSVGEAELVEVMIRVEGAPATIPTSSFVVEATATGVVSVSSVSFEREDRFNSLSGKQETTLRQSYRLQGLKVGSTQVSVTHALAPRMQVVADAKVAAPLSVQMAAKVTRIYVGEGTQLDWSSVSATRCSGFEGENGWGGNKTTSGTWLTGPLFQTTTYGLDCSNGRQGSVVYVTVQVVQRVPQPTP